MRYVVLYLVALLWLPTVFARLILVSPLLMYAVGRDDKMFAQLDRFLWWPFSDGY